MAQTKGSIKWINSAETAAPDNTSVLVAYREAVWPYEWCTEKAEVVGGRLHVTSKDLVLTPNYSIYWANVNLPTSEPRTLVEVFADEDLMRQDRSVGIC